jgi:hypothetical protein
MTKKWRAKATLPLMITPHHVWYVTAVTTDYVYHSILKFSMLSPHPHRKLCEALKPLKLLTSITRFSGKYLFILFFIPDELLIVQSGSLFENAFLPLARFYLLCARDVQYYQYVFIKVHQLPTWGKPGLPRWLLVTPPYLSKLYSPALTLVTGLTWQLKKSRRRRQLSVTALRHWRTPISIDRMFILPTCTWERMWGAQ